jgi:hypothetical protein
MSAEQQDFLDELREYFEDRQDADHNGTGYVANDEMKLLMRLNELFPEGSR